MFQKLPASWLDNEDQEFRLDPETHIYKDSFPKKIGRTAPAESGASCLPTLHCIKSNEIASACGMPKCLHRHFFLQTLCKALQFASL
jgi:hypothetical protein